MKRLKWHRIEMIVYEPVLKEESFYNSKVINNLDEFKSKVDSIIYNRLCKKLLDVEEKSLYT